MRREILQIGASHDARAARHGALTGARAPASAAVSLSDEPAQAFAQAFGALQHARFRRAGLVVWLLCWLWCRCADPARASARGAAQTQREQHR